MIGYSGYHDNLYLVAKEFGYVCKKFKTEISQYWLFDCVTFKITMVTIQRRAHRYETTCSWQNMLLTDVPGSTISSTFPNCTKEQ